MTRPGRREQLLLDAAAWLMIAALLAILGACVVGMWRIALS